MADYKLLVTADTQDAQRKLREIDRAAVEVEKVRNIKFDVNSIRDINKRFAEVKGTIQDVSNNVQTFYRFSKNIPGIGERVREFENLAKGTANVAKNAPASAAALRENAKAGSILSSSFEAAGGATSTLVNNLAKLGFSIFAVKEAVGVLQAAFGGFFNETIGREIKLRETILKTQTTLASTNKVFKGNQEITDPYQKIVSLTGEVEKRINSIRERSIALAGVTSSEVIDVFGIVASQVGQIGGGLKDAEDLAINFSAALGTFGIPLYQASQEIGSILRGDITTDSYLAKALGITNEEIAQAKTKTGGVVKFLEERLSAAVAGQRIAAQGFSGVVYNIRDLSELVGQNFGAGLLDPLLGGLTKVFDFLFKIREEVFAISKNLGSGIGSLLSTNLGIITGGSSLFTEIGGGAEGLAKQIADQIKEAFVSLQADANTFIAPLRNILEEVTKSIAVLAQGLQQLAKGFVDIKIEEFKALVQIFSNLAEGATVFASALSGVLSAYGSLLQQPVVQYLGQISAQFKLLEQIGVMSAVKIGFAAVSLMGAWQPIVAFFQGLVAKIAAALGGLVMAVGAAFTRIGALIAAFAATLTSTYPAVEALKQQLLGLSTSLTTAGVSADKAGASIARFGGATTAAARTVGTAIAGFIKFNLILLAVQIGITALIDAFGRYQQQQEAIRSTERASQALRELSTTYANVGDDADSATKAARDFRLQIVDAEYSKAQQELEDIRKKLNDLNYEAQFGIQTWGELFRRLGQFANPFDGKSLFDGDADEVKRLEQERSRYRQFMSDRDKQRDKEKTQENVRLEAQARGNAEKEIADLRKSVEDSVFQQRQANSQKEVEIFRAAGELRIFQIEQANAKLLEGEEGASASALEALNTYITTREKGELEIEGAKKELSIELANLERQVANYRLETEKRIAAIRKQSADYEQQAAAGAGGGGGGTAGIAQIANDRLTPQAKAWLATIRYAEGTAGPDGYRTMFTGKKFSDMSQHPRAIQRSNGLASDAAGAYQFLSTTWDSVGGGAMTPERQDRAGIALGQRRGVNFSNAPFTVENADRLAPEWASFPTKATGTSYYGQGGKKFGDLKAYYDRALAQYGGNASAAPAPSAASPAGTAPSAPAFEAPSTAEYEASVANLAGAMQRLRQLQAQLTSARTAAAFEQIAKAAFPKVALEQYDDQIKTVEVTLQALGQVSADVYDPASLEIAVDAKAKQVIQEREMAQILEKAQERRKEGTITEAELIKLRDGLKQRQTQYLKDLKKEQELRLKALDLTRQQKAIEDLRRDSAAIPFDLQRARVQSLAAMGGAFAGEDPVRKRQLQAEVAIAERRIQLEQDQTKTTEQVQAELADFAAKTRGAAAVLGELDAATEKYLEGLSQIRDGAKTLTDSYKGLVQSVLSGGNIQEATAQMSKTITDKVVGMALDYAFKPLEDMLVENLKKFFGVEDPSLALERENTDALKGNTEATRMLTQALTGAGIAGLPSAGEGLPGFGTAAPAFGGLEFDPQATMQVATENGAAFAASMSEVNESLSKAPTAAQEANKGMQNFLGGMAGVAAGAMSIFGGIQQIGKGGTSNTLAGIGSIFMGLGGALGGLNGMGLFGKRAGGGAVSAQRPYLVGEAGPELFLPGAGGTVTSASALRDAMGSGGGYGGTPVLSMSFQSTNIGGTEYVDRAQLEQAMAATRKQAARDGAKRGMSMALDKLQYSPATRNKLGMGVR